MIPANKKITKRTIGLFLTKYIVVAQYDLFGIGKRPNTWLPERYSKEASTAFLKFNLGKACIDYLIFFGKEKVNKNFIKKENSSYGAQRFNKQIPKKTKIFGAAA